MRTHSGVDGYVQTKYLVVVAPPPPQHAAAPPCKFHAAGNCHRGVSCNFSHASPHVSPQLAHSTSAPFVQNFCSRVLAEDREQSSFVPIVGLDKCADMTIDGALMHARHGCPKLQACLSDSDIQVRFIPATDTLPPCHPRSPRPSPLLPASTSCACPPPTPSASANTTPLPYTRAYCNRPPAHSRSNPDASFRLSQVHTGD